MSSEKTKFVVDTKSFRVVKIYANCKDLHVG